MVDANYAATRCLVIRRVMLLGAPIAEQRAAKQSGSIAVPHISAIRLRAFSTGIAGAVGPIGRERVEDVGGGDDARVHRDLLAGQL